MSRLYISCVLYLRSFQRFVTVAFIVYRISTRIIQGELINLFYNHVVEELIDIVPVEMNPRLIATRQFNLVRGWYTWN